jgi:hypothetical protein
VEARGGGVRAARLLVALALVVPIWVAHPLPLQDVASHEQVVAVLVHGTDWTGFGDRLALDPAPRPYTVVYFAWAALARVVGLDAASRVLVSWSVVGAFLAASALVVRVDPEKRARSLLAALFAYSELHYLGFVPLMMAVPTGLWLVARRIDPREGKRELAIDAALLLVTYLFHPIPALVAAVCVAAIAFGGRTRGERLGGLARLALVAAPCVLWAAAIALLARPRPLHPALQPEMLAPWKAALELALQPTAPFGWYLFWTVGGPARALALASLAAWALGIAALAVGPARAEPAGRRRAAVIALLASLAFLFLFPDKLGNGSALSLRAILFICPLALAVAPARGEGRAARVLTALAVAAALGTGLAAHLLAARERAALSPLVDAIPPRQAVLQPGTSPRSRVLLGYLLDVHLNAWARYHVHRGGLGPGGHITFSTSPVEVVKPVAPEECRWAIVARGDGDFVVVERR